MLSPKYGVTVIEVSVFKIAHQVTLQMNDV